MEKMKEATVQQKNIAIAEMMGYELITPQMRVRPETWTGNYWQKGYIKGVQGGEVLCHEDHLKFHLDWNWLMKAVEWINNNGGTSILYPTGYCTLESDSESRPFSIHISKDTFIEAVFESVYQFSNYVKTAHQ